MPAQLHKHVQSRNWHEQEAIKIAFLHHLAQYGFFLQFRSLRQPTLSEYVLWMVHQNTDEPVFKIQGQTRSEEFSAIWFNRELGILMHILAKEFGSHPELFPADIATRWKTFGQATRPNGVQSTIYVDKTSLRYCTTIPTPYDPFCL